MEILVYTYNIFFVFQRNSTMSSTTFNDVINLKPNWGCCFFMFFICFLIRNIDTWAFSTAPQYTFPVWKCMIRMRISAYSWIWHIRCFGINMTPMWHHCILYVSYMWCDFSPYLLLWAFWVLSFSFSNTYHARISMMNVSFKQKLNIHNHTWPCIVQTYVLIEWKQGTQCIITDNNLSIFIPSIFNTTIIWITYKTIM